MAHHHLRKLNDRKGLKITLEKMVTELEGKIEMNGQPIPARMNLNDQGLFILGYCIKPAGKAYPRGCCASQPLPGAGMLLYLYFFYLPFPPTVSIMAGRPDDAEA